MTDSYGAARSVHIVDDVPELDDPTGQAAGPVLVHALDGFLDAGNAGSLAVQHLLAGDAGRVVASFDVDSFYDYRARRPPMTFLENRYAGLRRPAAGRARDARRAAARRTSCCTGRSRTPAGRASPPRSARWSSTSTCG